MIDRVDQRLVLKPLNNRPYLHGETEPCINGRILGIGSYFKEPNDALAKQLLSEQLRRWAAGTAKHGRSYRPKRPPSRRSSFHTTICVLEGLLEYERAGRKSGVVTKARKRGEKLSARAAHVPLRFALAKSSTNAGCGSRSRRFGTTTS